MKARISAALAAIAGMMGTIAMAGTIEGTASYRERIALPPKAVLEVRLEDISRADAPAETLSLRRSALTGVPAAFQLDYDDALIEPKNSYGLRASITLDGKLLFVTDRAYPVLTRDAGNSADMVLVTAARPEPVGLGGTGWRVGEISGRVLTVDQPPEIRFEDDGAFGARGGCNRFTGRAEIGDGTLRFPETMAGTMMACPPPADKLETDFVAALSQVRGYVLSGDNLALTNAAGVTILRLARLP